MPTFRIRTRLLVEHESEVCAVDEQLALDAAWDEARAHGTVVNVEQEVVEAEE